MKSQVFFGGICMNRSRWISESLVAAVLIGGMLGASAKAQSLQTVSSGAAFSSFGALVVQDENQLLEDARGFIKAERYADAIKNLDTVIKLRPDAYRAFFDRGRAYFGMKKFKEADADFTKVTTLREQFANGWFNGGVTRVELKDWNGAIASFDKVIALNPSAKPAELNLVNESLHQKSLCYISLSNWQKAIETTTILIGKDPKRADTYLNRAYSLTKVNPPQNNMAIADYGAVITNATTDVQRIDAYFSRADLNIELNKFAEAVTDYTAGLKLDPKNVGAHSARASALFQLGKFDEALTEYDIVVQLSPNDADGYKNRAAVRLKKNDYSGAISDYTTFIQKAPKDKPVDPEIYRIRAAAYMNSKPSNYPGAIVDFQAYLAKKSDDAAAWKDLAVAQYSSIAPQKGSAFDRNKSSQLDAAITSAQKATTINAKLADAWLIIADSYSLQDKYQQSISPYTSYIGLEPSKTYGFDGRSRSRYNTKDYAGAVQDFDKLLALLPINDPSRPEIVTLRANALVNSGGTVSSADKIKALSDAIAASPNPISYTNRGVEYFASNDFDKAIADFQKAVDLDKEGKLEYLNNLASAYGKKADKTKADADYTNAANAYAKILAKKPADTNALAAQADLYMLLKQWDNAISTYTKFLATNPADAATVVKVLNNRAAAALSKTPPDYKTAAADYTQVTTKLPNDPKGFDLLGRVYYELKDYPNAIVSFEKYVTMNKQDSEAFVNLASSYYNVGLSKKSATGNGVAELDKSIASYTSAAGLKPSPEVTFSRGLASFRKSQVQMPADKKKSLKAGMADFEAATKLKADYADAWYYLALSADNYGVADELSQEEMFKKAIDAYTKYASLPTVKPAEADAAKKRIAQLKEAL
jgi:tetratricopeptide (TPR) repeat protein